MMKLNRCLPNGSLPYTSIDGATKMMLKLFEGIPYLPMLPEMSEYDEVAYKTLNHIPGVHFKDKRVLLNTETKDAEEKLKLLDNAFNKPSKETLERFKFDTAFLAKYLQIVGRLKPTETVVSLLGPFSMSQRFVTKEDVQVLADKNYRKLLIQAVSVRAMWIINKIKEVSPNTVPTIILEEPLLYKAGDIKRENEEVTNEVIVNLFSRIIAKINEAGAYVCIQCFEKCDWTIAMDAGVDIISFDAYNNPNNLSVMAEQVNEFLANGGRINWAIVPTKSETIVKSLSAEHLYDRLIKTMESFIDSGASEKLTYNNAMISLAGSTNKLPLIFAEKALILMSQVAKKIPVKS